MMKLLTAAALPFLVAADLLPQRPMRGGTPLALGADAISPAGRYFSFGILYTKGF